MHAILIPQFYVRVLRGPLGMVSSGHHMVMLGQDLRANSVEPYTLTSVDYGQLARHGKDCTLTNRSDSFRQKLYAKLPWTQYLCSTTKYILLMKRCLVIEYSQASCGVAAPIEATKLAVLMILPPVCKPFDSSVGFSRIASIAYLHPHQTPLALICMVRSQIFSSVLRALSSAGCIIPRH